jgi:2-keto-4-pentenoate hydratase
MLMSTQASRLAHALIKARMSGTLMPLLSTDGKLTVDDAYDVALSIVKIRTAQGENPVGRKIGFSNPKLWNVYGKGSLNAPIWSTIYDSTVHYAMDNVATHNLSKSQQPRIEPQLVFKLARTPEADIDLEGLSDCLEWIAHSFEVVTSPFRHWEFEAADAVAAFGLHRALIVGEPRMISRQSRHSLPQALASATMSLSRSVAGTSSLCAAGFGKDVQGSPLHALLALHQQLQQQPDAPKLQAGEIVSTGSWTNALPVKRGETWSSAFSQLNLGGLTVSFT